MTVICASHSDSLETIASLKEDFDVGDHFVHSVQCDKCRLLLEPCLNCHDFVALNGPGHSNGLVSFCPRCGYSHIVNKQLLALGLQQQQLEAPKTPIDWCLARISVGDSLYGQRLYDRLLSLTRLYPHKARLSLHRRIKLSKSIKKDPIKRDKMNASYSEKLRNYVRMAAIKDQLMNIYTMNDRMLWQLACDAGVDEFTQCDFVVLQLVSNDETFGTPVSTTRQVMAFASELVSMAHSFVECKTRYKAQCTVYKEWSETCLSATVALKRFKLRQTQAQYASGCRMILSGLEDTNREILHILDAAGRWVDQWDEMRPSKPSDMLAADTDSSIYLAMVQKDGSQDVASKRMQLITRVDKLQKLYRFAHHLLNFK